MRILIVKLGALGDVLRTTPLLTALKQKYPACRITWVVDGACRDVLEGNAHIAELLTYSPAIVDRLRSEEFDLAINLDKEKEALDSVTAAKAPLKMGFGRSASGELCALDEKSDYAYRLGIDDELKFKKNEKTYQQISFEQLGLRFNREEYLFEVGAENLEFARKHLTSLGVDLTGKKPLIGLNTGSGHRFAGKRLPVQTFADLARRFQKEANAQVLLLGGKDELERNAQIERLAAGAAVATGSHSIRRFAGIVRCCDLVLTGDTTAMHIAIAMKTPVLTYFGSTCASEIELYGRGKKIVSTLSCAPCYKKICPIDEQCMKDMSVDILFGGAKPLLKSVQHA